MRPPVGLGLVFVSVCGLLAACKREAAPTRATTTAAPSVASSATAPPRDARFREVEEQVERWQRAQNELDFEAYSALYAPVFRGTKRVADKSYRFDRQRWLADRKPMFVSGLKVLVNNLEIKPAGAHFAAFFEQEFRTPAFHDRGRKLLAFARTESGLRIVREELLSSDVLGGGGSVSAVPGFFFARADGVVLRSEIDERWLTPSRRELARQFRKAREAGEPEECVDEGFLDEASLLLPPEVTAFQGKTLHVTRAPAPGSRKLPEPCVRRISRIVLRNTALPSFESVRVGMGYDHIFGTVVLGVFDEPCPGALWASESAPGKQYVPEPARGPLLEAAQRAITSRGDYPELSALLVGDAEGRELVFARGARPLDSGDEDVHGGLFRVERRRLPLERLGSLDADYVPRLAFDANGDGELEVLTQPTDNFSTVYVLRVGGAGISAHAVYSEPDFVCPG